MCAVVWVMLPALFSHLFYILLPHWCNPLPFALFFPGLCECVVHISIDNGVRAPIVVWPTDFVWHTLFRPHQHCLTSRCIYRDHIPGPLSLLPCNKECVGLVETTPVCLSKSTHQNTQFPAAHTFNFLLTAASQDWNQCCRCTYHLENYTTCDFGQGSCVVSTHSELRHVFCIVYMFSLTNN